MTTLILQTAALLLCAYFLGAWVACLLRRTFFAAGDADDMPAAFERSVQAMPAAGYDTAARVAPPARRPDPKPIAIEAIERSVPHAASDAASRFEEVLTTAPKAVVPAAPAPTPAAPPVTRPVATAPVVAPVAVAPVAPVAPVAKPAVPAPAVTAPTPASAASVNAGAIAQAAAAAAAKAAAAAIVPAVAAAAPKPAPAPANMQFPAASSGAGPSAVSAPIAAPTPPPVAPAADDLMRIRAIDAELQRRLVGLGVSRYRDIAGWLPTDVERLSRELGFTGRIEQENWIEQAQILARGGETAYARRIANGQVATAAPSPNQGAVKPAPAPVPAPAAPVTVAAPVPAKEAAAPVEQPSTPVSLPQVETRAAFAPSPKPAAVIEAVPAAVTPVAAPAPVVVPTAPTPAAPGLAAAAAAAAAAGLGAASGLGRDNLQRIGGINTEVERLLNVQGVSRYSQIAGWSATDIGRIDRLLGHEGRVARENWIEQAATLAKGGDTAHSRQFDQRSVAAKPHVAVVDAPRPSRLADAIRDTATKPVAEAASAVATAAAPIAAATAAAVAAAAASGARTSDLSAMRSVRSEAYAPQIGARASGGHDDLKRIRGVGVLIEKKLYSMGVTTYAQVANWSGADIDRVSQVLDFKGRIERENWVEQARILSAGGQTEFSRRVDRGEVETSRG